FFRFGHSGPWWRVQPDLPPILFQLSRVESTKVEDWKIEVGFFRAVHLRSFAPICGEVRFPPTSNFTIRLPRPKKVTKNLLKVTFDGYNHLQVTSTSKGDLKPT